MQVKQYPAKSIIFRENEPGQTAYIVHSGKVEILKHADHGEVPLAVIEQGGVFGEMVFFDPEGVRSATARAMEDCVLKELSTNDFNHLVECCPSELMPFLFAMIGRLKAMNTRVAQKERATVQLDSAINLLTLEGANALEGKFAPVFIQAANLPFSIGGYLEGERPTGKQMLSLPCKPDPQHISNHHCNIEVQDKQVFIVEQGSLFRTIVNGKEIGRGRPDFRAPLNIGLNKILLGGYSSPYQLNITCE
ncbi:MAG: cyclic nucleotide-binding domain-containing protein [Rickettsiales bacterium]